MEIIEIMEIMSQEIFYKKKENDLVINVRHKEKESKYRFIEF